MSIAVHLALAGVAWCTMRDVIPIMTASGAIGRRFALQMAFDPAETSLMDESNEIDVELTDSIADAKTAERPLEIEPNDGTARRLQTAFAMRPAPAELPPSVDSPLAPAPSESRADHPSPAIAPKIAKAMVPRRRSAGPGAAPVVVNKPVVAAPQTANGSAQDDARSSDLAGIPEADQVDQPPREPAGNPKPEYPPREKQLGIEGLVVLRILIDETGRVVEAKIVNGPPAFGRSVLAVAKSWRFEPARHQGRPVSVWGVKEVSFTHPRNKR